MNTSKLSTKPKIIVIVGPTASGKTDLAIKIAHWVGSRQTKSNGTSSQDVPFVAITARKSKIKGVEIVSADSRQIYRGMDIGTAKPTKEEMKEVKHYLIDVKNPNQPYAVAQYKRGAIRAIRKILKKNKLPILVGGTGLYIKAVVDNLEIPKVKPNPRLRRKLEKKLKEEGLETLYRELIERDPEAAYIVDRNNPRRVIRALEITLETDKPFSAQRKQGKKIFDALKIGINPGKEKLKKKIEKRVDEMIKGGLIDEVKSLISKYPPKFEKNSRDNIRDKLEKQYPPAFDAIGYREIIRYIQDEVPLPHAVALIKRNTWLYAKRQITWFKKDKEVYWIKKAEEATRLLREFLLPS